MEIATCNKRTESTQDLGAKVELITFLFKKIIELKSSGGMDKGALLLATLIKLQSML